MPCRSCDQEYAEAGVIAPTTASAVAGLCVSCWADSLRGEPAADDLGWEQCVMLVDYVGAAVSALEGSAGQPSAAADMLREAVDQDERNDPEAEPETRAALRVVLPLLRGAGEAKLADAIERGLR